MRYVFGFYAIQRCALFRPMFRREVLPAFLGDLYGSDVMHFLPLHYFGIHCPEDAGNTSLQHVVRNKGKHYMAQTLKMRSSLVA
jgi:hypothetical protein